MHFSYFLERYFIWELHAGGLTGHFGREKTIEAVDNLFYWPSLKKDVAKLIGQYRTCQLGKQNKHNTSFYTPLPVPDRPWQDVSVDFVLGLPKTIRRHDSIFVVVDCSKKWPISCHAPKMSDAYKIAQIHFDGVVKLHGLTKTIVSDRDVNFMSYFWKTL